MLPALSEKAGHPLSGFVGLADVAGTGGYQVFVMVNDPSTCGDGCRTLAYRWDRRRWRLVADAPAVEVRVKPGTFAYATKDGKAEAWDWRGDARGFVARDP